MKYIIDDDDEDAEPPSMVHAAAGYSQPLLKHIPVCQH